MVIKYIEIKYEVDGLTTSINLDLDAIEECHFAHPKNYDKLHKDIMSIVKRITAYLDEYSE